MKLMGGGGVDIIFQVNPEYKQHVRYEYGNKVLYLLVSREIYGCIGYALLWCNIFPATFEGIGFEINPFDRCVANNMI